LGGRGAFSFALEFATRLTYSQEDLCSGNVRRLQTDNYVSLIEPFLQNEDERVSGDAAACVEHIRHGLKSIEHLLEEVTDRESFIGFALALAQERKQAERIERENPNVYMVDGALGWMNGSID
jgi:hypothetical protein